MHKQLLQIARRRVMYLHHAGNSVAGQSGTIPPFHHYYEGGFTMVFDLFFYALVLIGLLWLCLMLHYVWPSDRSTGDQRTSKPPNPSRKPSRDPKPFPGLTHKPCCVACEQAAQAPTAPPPPPPPPPITSRRGRPRQVDTSQHFGPNPECAYQGRGGLGNLSANAIPAVGLGASCTRSSPRSGRPGTSA
jgi:hypothetical protein